jgi:KDO2-lipid IV(A) lauroyltransferase
LTIWVSAPLRLLLTALALGSSLLPRRFELWLGPLLGRLVLRLGFFKRKTAYDNIRRCFPELGETGWNSMLRRNFEHYGILFFEFTHFFSPFPGHYRRYAMRNCSLEGMENWERAQAKGKGVLFVSCHVGFWEMVAAAAGLSGKPITIVTTVLKPGWLDCKITECRLSTGVRAAYHPGSIPAVLRALRRGEAVAFMNDQYFKPPMGLPVRFFGVQVDTLAAVATLAHRTGAAILPGWGWRDEDGVMRVHIEPELELGAGLDVVKTTQVIASKVEEWVRRRPEQWLWMHRRFKNATWPTNHETAPPQI